MFEIDVDLIYAQIPFEKIETDFDIMDDEIIEGNKNARSILALAGVRCLKIIRQDYICQNQELLVLLMRYVKIWAKNRLIYSNIAGYLSGHSLSIMSAKICIKNPEATSLSFVIKQFFNVYKAWNWGEEPLFLVDLVDTNEEFENASEIVEPWRVKYENFDSSSETGSSEKRGKKNEGNDGTQMSIITPGFPEQNTTFNVNKFTLKRIIMEFKRGFALINRESTGVWNELIAEVDWKTHGLISCKLWIVGVNLNRDILNLYVEQNYDMDTFIGQLLTLDEKFKNSSTKPDSLYSVYANKNNLEAT
uniref:polynucleotide adenylyltransferase n=1 Tax=Meloidogyne floridensis TaxID=298350 RepID=A0A915NIN4_9BILA